MRCGFIGSKNWKGSVFNHCSNLTSRPETPTPLF